MTLSRFRAVDIETVISPDGDERVCEVGWFDVTADEGAAPAYTHELHSALIDPGCEIDAMSRSIHHITPAEMTGLAVQWDSWFPGCLDWPDALVAHSASYEARFIDTRTPFICTYKVARRLWPRLPSFKLQYLRYHLDLPVDPVLSMPPHRAGPDSYVTGILFARMLELMPAQQMIDVSLQPALLYRCHLKKHKDVLWEDVARIDPGYLQWIVAQPDMGEDVVYTAGYWLRRAG